MSCFGLDKKVFINKTVRCHILDLISIFCLLVFFASIPFSISLFVLLLFISRY